jgi:hypothetical protein
VRHVLYNMNECGEVFSIFVSIHVLHKVVNTKEASGGGGVRVRGG